MSFRKLLVVVSMFALFTPLAAFAHSKNEGNVKIPNAVQVGNKKLEPGNYKVRWEGAGPGVQVSFIQYGKTVATVAGTLKMNDKQVTEDDVVTDTSTPHTQRLKEIDFQHHKEALIFGTSGM
jgi:hypothetical protein